MTDSTIGSDPDVAERPLAGGPLAVDLLNTRWGTGDDHVDWFEGDAEVTHFAAVHGHPPDSGADVASMRRSLRSARDLVQRVLDAGVRHEIDDALVAEVDRALATARVVMWAPAGPDDAPDVAITGDDASSALAVESIVDAIRVLGDHDGRIRSCEHDACTLWFVDTSRSGRRRWCSMETCGNRVKARRHYERNVRPGRDAGAVGSVG